jgi:O-succinylbenzoate synthase
MDDARLERDLLHATLYTRYVLGTGTLVAFIGWQANPQGDLLTMAIVDHETQTSRQGIIVDTFTDAMRRLGYRFDLAKEDLHEVGIVFATTVNVSSHERLAALTRLCGTEGVK